MGRYRVRYVAHADEQLRQLPPSMRTAFDAKLEELKTDPHAVGDHDKSKEGFATTPFADTGIIMYSVSDEVDMVTVLRIFWSEW